MLLDHRFIAETVRSEEDICQRRAPSRPILWHILARPGCTPWRIWPKTITLVEGDEYFIPTKFRQNPLNSFGEELLNEQNLLRTDKRTMNDGLSK